MVPSASSRSSASGLIAPIWAPNCHIRSMPAVATAFCAWARIEMNSTCWPLLSTPLGGGGIRPSRAMMLNTRVTSGCKSSSCSRSNRPEHQHLLLAPLVDLARGDLAAVRLGQHQEQVGVERLLDAALHLADVGGERAEVEAHVDCRPEALAVRIGDIGDAARQQARRL